MSARETAELLLQVGRLVQAGGYAGELSPAQWMALRYLTRANTLSRTPSALASFQATTRGTASQVIKALEAGGYLVRSRSSDDGRSSSLRLTDKGYAAVARDPYEMLVSAVASLDEAERAGMHAALRRVLGAFAASGQHRHFGVCRDCTHLSGAGCCDAAAVVDLRCLCFDVPIEPSEADLLCVHFEPTDRKGPGGA